MWVDKNDSNVKSDLKECVEFSLTHPASLEQRLISKVLSKSHSCWFFWGGCNNRWQHRVTLVSAGHPWRLKFHHNVCPVAGGELSGHCQGQSQARMSRRWAASLWLVWRFLDSSGGSFMERISPVTPAHTFSSSWERLWVHVLQHHEIMMFLMSNQA